MSLRIYDVEQRETWRTIPGFSADYEVSDLGRVRSYRGHGGKRRELVPHLLATRISTAGYLSVGLQVERRPRAFNVHRLVAAAFIGPRPDGQQVAHADGDRTNARLSNLRYATPVENAQDKHLHGTTCRGVSNGRHKLTEAQVRRVFGLYRAGRIQSEIAEACGISQSQVSNILRGASWAHLGLAKEAS